MVETRIPYTSHYCTAHGTWQIVLMGYGAKSLKLRCTKAQLDDQGTVGRGPRLEALEPCCNHWGYLADNWVVEGFGVGLLALPLVDAEVALTLPFGGAVKILVGLELVLGIKDVAAARAGFLLMSLEKHLSVEPVYKVGSRIGHDGVAQKENHWLVYGCWMAWEWMVMHGCKPWPDVEKEHLVTLQKYFWREWVLKHDVKQLRV